MNILIPMAGEGKRFSEAGYQKSKPAIPTYDRRSGEKVPMVVCATMDLPYVGLGGGANLIYVDRDFHRNGGVEDEIRKFYPDARFINVGHLTEGQASTCLLAEPFINNDEELLIAGCDNGMEYSVSAFDRERQEADVLVFTYRNNECVMDNPDAYGWMDVDGNNRVLGTSIKKALSDNPMQDHAVVATFWFKHGRIFVDAAKKMIREGDRIKNEFYVDQTIRHILQLGHIVKVFEIDRYIGWGTPEDYELYQRTFDYWRGFCKKEKIK